MENRINNLVSEKIKEVLSNDENILVSTLQEINCTNGNFENLQFYNNDEDFFDTYFNNNPYEVARATFYGDYRFNDDYVYFNAYGNLASFNYINEFVSDSDIEDITEDIISNYSSYDLDYSIEVYTNLLEYEDEQLIKYENIIKELQKNDRHSTYDEILEENNYILSDSIEELKSVLYTLINDIEYIDYKEEYEELLNKLENIEL